MPFFNVVVGVFPFSSLFFHTHRHLKAHRWKTIRKINLFYDGFEFVCSFFDGFFLYIFSFFLLFSTLIDIRHCYVIFFLPLHLEFSSIARQKLLFIRTFSSTTFHLSTKILSTQASLYPLRFSARTKETLLYSCYK